MVDHSDAPSVHVRFRLRYPDLYWMYLTTWITPPTVLLGLYILTGPLWVPVENPGGLFAAGIAILAMGVLGVPIALMFATGASAYVGTTISLRIDDTGVEGWGPGSRYDIVWAALKRPRFESRVVVLPFNPRFSARRCWVTIPRRALTPEQSAALLALLRAHGFLRTRSGRSVTGRILGIVLDRFPRSPKPETVE